MYLKYPLIDNSDMPYDGILDGRLKTDEVPLAKLPAKDPKPVAQSLDDAVAAATECKLNNVGFLSPDALLPRPATLEIRRCCAPGARVGDDVARRAYRDSEEETESATSAVGWDDS